MECNPVCIQLQLNVNYKCNLNCIKNAIVLLTVTLLSFRPLGMILNFKSVLKAVAVVSMLTTGLFLSAATISEDGKQTKKLSITDDYLVQRQNNQITPFGSSGTPSGCAGVADELQCVYQVTEEGKANIPSLASLSQTHYTPAQINSYLSQSPTWLVPAPGSSIAIYQF
jgi:hypothetical protein